MQYLNLNKRKKDGDQSTHDSISDCSNIELKIFERNLAKKFEIAEFLDRIKAMQKEIGIEKYECIMQAFEILKAQNLAKSES